MDADRIAATVHPDARSDSGIELLCLSRGKTAEVRWKKKLCAFLT
jgi:hypothetical protein